MKIKSVKGDIPPDQLGRGEEKSRIILGIGGRSIRLMGRRSEALERTRKAAVGESPTPINRPGDPSLRHPNYDG